MDNILLPRENFSQRLGKCFSEQRHSDVTIKLVEENNDNGCSQTLIKAHAIILHASSMYFEEALNNHDNNNDNNNNSSSNNNNSNNDNNKSNKNNKIKKKKK